MTAKEMFKKLGYYKKTILDENEEVSHIIYEYAYQKIDFDIAYKQIQCKFEYNGLETIKAINKQIEELGWNNA